MGRGLCARGSGVCICARARGAACDRAPSRAQLSAARVGSCSVDGCTCDIGYGGDAGSAVRPVCPHNARGHGTCSQRASACDRGFGARDCSVALANACPENCSGGGARSADVSATRFGGAACDKCWSPGCPAACSGRGSCTPAPACACEASAAQAASLPTAQPACPSNCSGRGACLDGVCAATRDGPGARATASSRSRVHLTWAARLRARPTAQRCRRERSHRAAHVLVRARFRGGGVRRGAPLVPVRRSGRGECRALALRGAPADSHALDGLAQLLRAMHAGRDERARAAAVDSLQVLTTAQLEAASSRPARRRRRYPRLAACATTPRSSPRGRRAADGVSPADSCPNGCSGRGFCRAAGCVCEAGFGGADCGIACSPERWSGCAWV